MKEFLRQELKNVKGLSYIVSIPIEEFSSIAELDTFVKEAKHMGCGVVMKHETSNFHQGVVVELFDKKNCNVKDCLDI